MSRISQTKKKSENRVCAEALNYREKCFIEPARYKLRPRVNRRQCRIDYKNKNRPSGSDYQFMKHPAVILDRLILRKIGIFKKERPKAVSDC